jgi:hypothetical protein
MEYNDSCGNPNVLCLRSSRDVPSCNDILVKSFAPILSIWHLIFGLNLYQLSSTAMGYRGQFEKFVNWRQRAAVTQREAVTVIPSCSGGGNVVVA